MKHLTGKQVIAWSLITTVVLELITIILRFGCRLESTRDTASTVGVLTQGVRIHHGYVGVLVVVIALLCSRAWSSLSRWQLVAGSALICSDVFHHFVVLWLIVGSPEFDLMY